MNSLTKLSLRFPMVKPDSDFENLSNITFKVNQMQSSTTVHTWDVPYEIFFFFKEALHTRANTYQ